jgi:hypothetical protein
MPATVSHIKTSPIADFTGTVTVGNSSGGTQTMLASQLVLPSDWNSVHSVQFQLTGSEIGSLFNAGGGLSLSTNAAGVTFGEQIEPYFEPFPFPLTASTSHTPGIGTWYFDPVKIPSGLSSGVIRTPVTCGGALMNSQSFAMTNASNTGAASHWGTFWHNIAIYAIQSNNTAASTVWTRQLTTGITRSHTVITGTATSNIVVSNYATINFPAQWDTAGEVTYSSITASGAITQVGTSLAAASIDSLLAAANTYLTGSRMDIFGFNTTLGGDAYILAHQFMSSTSGATTGGYILASGTLMSTNVRSPMMLELNFAAYRQVGKSSSNTLSQAYPWHGVGTVTNSLAPNPIGTADLRNTNVRMYWNYNNIQIS